MYKWLWCMEIHILIMPYDNKKLVIPTIRGTEKSGDSDHNSELKKELEHHIKVLPKVSGKSRKWIEISAFYFIERESITDCNKDKSSKVDANAK